MSGRRLRRQASSSPAVRLELALAVVALTLVSFSDPSKCAAQTDDQSPPATVVSPGDKVNLLRTWPVIAKAPKDQLATIEFWVCPDGAAIARPRAFLWILADAGGRDSAGLSLTLFNGAVRASVLGMRMKSAQPLPADRWSHVALTVNTKTINKQATLWLDGKQVAQELILEPWPATFAVAEMFSDHWNQGRAFTGRIGDVRVSKTIRYRRPFTPPRRLPRDPATTFHLPGGNDP